MEKHKIRLVFGLALFAILLLLSVQTYWLTQTYQAEANKLDEKIGVAMEEAKMQVDTLITPALLIRQDENSSAAYFWKDTSTNLTVNYYVLLPRSIRKELSEIRKRKLDELSQIISSEKQDTTRSSLMIIDFTEGEDFDHYSFLQQRRNDVDSILTNVFADIGSRFDYSLMKLDSLSCDKNDSFEDKYKYHFHVARGGHDCAEGTAIVFFFEDLNLSIYKNMGMAIGITVLMVVFLGFILWYFTKVIFTEGKLNEIKNDFINNMTHELKTPLATIRFATANIENDSIIQQPKEVKSLTRVISEQSNLMNDHVERVLLTAKAARKELDLKQELIGVNELIRQCALHFQYNLEGKGHISTTLAQDEKELKGDKALLSGVFTNLIDNAIKYSNEKVEIFLSTQFLSEGVKVEVSDKGIGIKPEHQTKIFDRFYRVPSGNMHNVKGFGLGLNFVHEIITLHRGDIHVKSTLGMGTTFEIFIPYGK